MFENLKEDFTNDDLKNIFKEQALQAALSLGLPPNYLKLLMAALLTLALISKEFGAKERYVTGKEVTNENAG